VDGGTTRKVEWTIARIAALSGSGSFDHALIMRVRSGQDGIGFRESIRELWGESPLFTDKFVGFEYLHLAHFGPNNANNLLAKW